MDPDRIYFNVTAAAGVVTTTFAVAPLAYYQEQRDPPLVQHQEDFELAVERFSITGVRSLPVYIPPIIPDVDNPSNPFKTALALTLSAAAAPGAVQTPVPGTYSLRVGVFPQDGSVFDNVITFNSSATTVAGFVDALQEGLNAVLGVSIINVALNAGIIIWSNSASPFLPFRVGPATDATVSTAPFGFAPVAPGTDPSESNLVPVYFGPGTIAIGSPSPAWYSTTPGASVTLNVQWQPQSYGYPPPRAPGPDVDIAANPLYWCFDYEWFATVLNAALVAATEQLKAKLETFAQDYMPPFVLYDNASARFVLYGDANYTPFFRKSEDPTPISPGYPILISLNEPLQNLLLLPAVYDTDGNAEVSWAQSPRVIPPGFTDTAPKWVSATPNYSSVGSGWSPIQSIVFVSSRISVRNEAVSLPTVFGETDNSGFGGIATFTQTTQQQITDIVPNITDSMQWIAQSTIYQPSVLRYIDVLGVGPLNKIDFQVFWKHRITGVCYPLSLNPLAAFEAKVMLKKKGVLSCF